MNNFKFIDPKGSVNVLNEVKFNPVQKLTELDAKIEKAIQALLFDEDGEVRQRPNMLAVTALMNTRQKISADLLRFAYRRVPETSEIEHKNIPPIQIQLTNKSKV